MIGISSLPISKVIDSPKVLAFRQRGTVTGEHPKEDSDIQDSGVPIKTAFFVGSNLLSGSTRYIELPKNG